ncbi:hypothetical protein GCM10010909_00590 [Acidocella aquatica]|uniref:Uncharacterized protein n=1 Tax=Acidocella aquatica TaxID=1922313 RepID=A0ABQ6A0P7_9PROT|nr:hypothetical protein [Acidocella aquatica]GLR65381.1 hypothetical protein GCM10010909_00590 [Acidocella aquatica]
MFRTVQTTIITGVLLATLAGASVAQAAPPPAATNDMTQGNSGMMGSGNMMSRGGMMGDYGKIAGKTGGNMMGMMAMMTACTNMMTAQINMMNAMTNEINAQTKLLTHGAAPSAGPMPK